MARAKVNGRGWQPIESVPRETKITVETVKGRICTAKVLKGAKFLKPFRGMPKRMPAKRLDLNPPMQGDVRAVRWKHL